MTESEIMATLATLGGAGAWVLRYLADRRKSALEEAQAMLAEMHKLHGAVTAEHSSCRDMLRQAEQRIEQLTARVEALESNESPFFSWIEDAEGRVLSMSAAFRRGVLTPARLADEAVIGHRLIDLEVFRDARGVLAFLDRIAILKGYSGASDVMLTPARWAVIKALVIAPDGSRQIHCAAVPQ